MIQYNIYRGDDNRHLVLIFAGWGMDHHLLDGGWSDSSRDCMICYDYSDLSFDYELLSGYDRIDLYGWSMGVWAASHTLQGHDLPIADSTAINGTLYPIDAQRGIDPSIYAATLEAISAVGMRSFYRRMCASDRGLMAHFGEHASQRSLEDLRHELSQIALHVETLTEPTFEWSRAIVGGRDLIFMPEAQRRAWGSVPVVESDDAHYVILDSLF